MDRAYSAVERHRLIRRLILTVVLTSPALFLYGNYLFEVLGIALDAFRVGAGILLMLSVISLVQGKDFYEVQSTHDIAVW